MSRAPDSLRHALAAAMFVAASALPVASASAQTSTLNFNGLTDPANVGVREVANCYTEAGYTVTVVGVACGTPGALATGSPASPLLYTGSPALFLNSPVGTMIDFTRVGGGAFSFQSIQFAPFLSANTTVSLTGFGTTGAQSFFAQFVIPGSLMGLQTFTTTLATGLASLRLSAVNQFGEPIVHFDNVVFAAAAVNVVPEPATFGLVFIGLAGIGAIARRRRAV